MKFCWVTLMVRDLEESLKFYNEIVGLDVRGRFEAGPVVEIAFLGDGDTKVELICNKRIKELSPGRDVSLGFEVDSLDRMMEIVKEKGIDIESGPIQPNPHTKFFFVLDPNGYRIQFVENR